LLLYAVGVCEPLLARYKAKLKEKIRIPTIIARSSCNGHMSAVNFAVRRRARARASPFNKSLQINAEHNPLQKAPERKMQEFQFVGSFGVIIQPLRKAKLQLSEKNATTLTEDQSWKASPSTNSFPKCSVECA